MITDVLLQKFKATLQQNKFSGNIALDVSTRVINSTDNSIYELMPQAILQPKSIDDIQIIFKIANLQEFKNLTFTPRGGGTGTNAQSLTNGVVIDTSRYMRKIYNLDTVNNTITVHAGVVLSELNIYLKSYGLFFAPMISTADRATIGGMIATDAAGKGSLIYGKTSDYIVNIDLVMSNGNALSTNQTIDNVSIKLTRDVMELLNNKDIQNEIQNRFPPLKRPLSGYNIKQCYSKIDKPEKIDFNRLICGSEGTLGFVAHATLKLLPIPKYKVLVVVHYDTFLDALKDADFLIKHEAMAIEAVDEKVQKCATTLANWPYLSGLLGLSSVDLCVSNFIEFTEHDVSVLDEKISRLKHSLDTRNSRYVIIKDSNQINQLWSIRSLAVGLAARMSGSRKPIAFVEDCIVPPENLYSFVQDMQDLFKSKNLNYAMYGHVDVGCIHVRPALDMQDQFDRDQIRPITNEVIKLTDKYHGLLWGEHGKGVRGEFVQNVFGEVLYPVLQKIKLLFDPENRLNPGKLVTPFQHKTAKLMQIDKITMRGELDNVIPTKIQDEYISAMLCNGNAACFNREISNVMCPSYKVTNDRIHSPKGRAMLVKQWLRSVANRSDIVENKIFADMALSAMSGCLGCKGCSGKCPSQVSIPDLRAKFLNDYYSVYKYKKRSLRDYVLAYTEHLLSTINNFQILWNLINKLSLGKILKLQHLPMFPSGKNLDAKLKSHNIPIYQSVKQIVGDKPIVIIADVFSGLFNPEILLQSVDVLRILGYTPYIIKPMASGKSLIVAGMLKQFNKVATKLSLILNPLLENKIPVVGLENSIVLMYRDEYTKFAAPLKGRVLTLAEVLASDLPNIANKIKLKDLSRESQQCCLLPHCTEQAILPNESSNWVKIFNTINIELKVKNLGCCGMAGLYGHQSENVENSYKLYNDNWKINIEDSLQYVATGFSCRSQVERIDSYKLKHPIQVLWQYCV